MKFTITPNAYAEWTPGSRTINYYAFTIFYTFDGQPIEGRWVNYDCASFGYDKPDNSTTALEALAVIMRNYPEACGSCGSDTCPCFNGPLSVYFVDEEA